MRDVLAQLFGILALIIMVLSYQQKERGRLLIFQMVSNAFFAVSYYMLGAFSGAVMSLVNIARSFVFSRSDTKWGKSPVWLYVFLAASLAGGILSWEGPLSLLVIAATLVLTFTLYSKDLRFMRKMFLLPPLLYISYNLINKSIGGIGSDVFCLVSAVLAIWRFDIRKDSKAPEQGSGQSSQDETSIN